MFLGGVVGQNPTKHKKIFPCVPWPKKKVFFYELMFMVKLILQVLVLLADFTSPVTGLREYRALPPAEPIL